jgi:hypothetical protein
MANKVKISIYSKKNFFQDGRGGRLLKALGSLRIFTIFYLIISSSKPPQVPLVWHKKRSREETIVLCKFL